MFARAALAIVLVLLAGTSLATAEVCCDETALIDEALAAREVGPVGDLPSPRVRPLASVAPHDQPYASPALARVFRPPR